MPPTKLHSDLKHRFRISKIQLLEVLLFDNSKYFTVQFGKTNTEAHVRGALAGTRQPAAARPTPSRRAAIPLVPVRAVVLWPDRWSDGEILKQTDMQIEPHSLLVLLTPCRSWPAPAPLHGGGHNAPQEEGVVLLFRYTVIQTVTRNVQKILT